MTVGGGQHDNVVPDLVDPIGPPSGESDRDHQCDPIDVKAIRRASGLSQQGFASTYGITLGALRDWEQGRKHPERAARVLLRVIAVAPDAVARAVAGS